MSNSAVAQLEFLFPGMGAKSRVSSLIQGQISPVRGLWREGILKFGEGRIFFQCSAASEIIDPGLSVLLD